MFAYLVSVGSARELSFFHKISQLTGFTPEQWVGNRHATLRLRCSCLPL
jgi:hypothetical protein